MCIGRTFDMKELYPWGFESLQALLLFRLPKYLCGVKKNHGLGQKLLAFHLNHAFGGFLYLSLMFGFHDACGPLYAGARKKCFLG